MLLILSLLTFNQNDFDKYIEQDRVVIVKYVKDIPTMERAIVRILIRQNDVIVMTDYSQYNGDLFLGIYTKDTKVLFYGKHK